MHSIKKTISHIFRTKLLCLAFLTFPGLCLLVSAHPAGAVQSPAQHSIQITEPLPGTIYPPDMASPRFLWKDSSQSTKWVLRISRSSRILFEIALKNPWWLPEPSTWEKIKKAAGNDRLEITISGSGGEDSRKAVSRAKMDFSFSRDGVNARIMFMRKPLPFSKALKNPEQTGLLLGEVDSYAPPRAIMSSPPICANCHAYSARGDHLTLDTDFKGDKGGFLFAPMDGKITIDEDSIYSWNSLAACPPADYSMGLFARLSPEGRYIAGTVSETSVFVQMSDVYFSQLFFPATGQLAVFDTQTKKIDLLPGAAREDMVQTGPGWSPDGRSIAFSAAPVEPALIGKVLDKTVYNESSNQNIFQLNKKYPVKFDIYTLPFNQGKGGTARPLEGASNNGFSNYFPRYSPDGKWIVYTRSPTGLVLQPYSKLYIVPATGGRARELESNQPVMNSWHSWSPNSKWLVFTSKANSPFTELYLTHINNKGNASPAIRLFRFSSNDLAAMVPEFIPESATIPRAITYGPGTKGKSMATDGR